MMCKTIEELVEKIKLSEKQYDLQKIMQAYNLANSAHEGQLRSSGDPYISHPISVASILLDYCMDTDTICAALLHDVVEDTDTSLEVIKKKFGEDVAVMVDGVTKIGLVPLNSKEEQQAENIRKILMAMSKDIRVIIIKLADRLHNMRTLDARPPHKQLKTSLETMNFYAPIAHRLGMSDVKEEMEDIAIHYLDPFGCKEVERQLELHKGERDNFIDTIIGRIRERITDIKPDPIIEGRVKSAYSIYKKVYVKNKPFDEIYDIYAVRVIVQSVIECYNVLGVIHDMFRPIPYRFKDYISTPKPNRYQSLHTTVIGREGIPFEVQIRTVEMHNTAQYGVAAHWKYKAGISKGAGEQRFDWIRQILERQQEADDVEQIADAIKTDLAQDEVFAFTPKGDVRALPMGATVLDFAYNIHTQVGNKMTGAKVGGRMVSFDYEIKTGDIVEILTSGSANYGPNRNWLEIAKTTEAKGKIRSWFKKERREENIERGKAELEHEFKRNGIAIDNDQLLKIAQRQRFDNIDDLYAAIGYEGVSLSKIIQRLKEEQLRLQKEQGISPTVSSYEDIEENNRRSRKKGIIVEGVDNCLVKFAQCCNPLPGDPVIGFVTRGFGVSIHKQDCINVINNMEAEGSKERWINASWAGVDDSTYRATIDIITEDRTAMIADISVAIASYRIPIHEMNAHQLKNGNANLLVTIEVAGMEQLNSLMQNVRKIPGVLSVERTGKQ